MFHALRETVKVSAFPSYSNIKYDYWKEIRLFTSVANRLVIGQKLIIRKKVDWI